MILIAGLGNPGAEYEHTRHNIGFDVIDLLADKWNITSWKHDMRAEIASVSRNGTRILLVKPQTFMNNSGEAIGEIASYYKIDPAHIFICCDDLDLDPGRIRIRKKGSDGGHNGIKSIIANLHTQNFNRFRIGIGHPKDGHTVVQHVLGRPYGEDLPAIKKAESDMVCALEAAVDEGVDHAMNLFNSRHKK